MTKTKEKVPKARKPRKQAAPPPPPGPRVEGGLPQPVAAENQVDLTFPTYEGVQVTRVVEKNINGRWHRCEMADGTVRDVPLELFRA